MDHRQISEYMASLNTHIANENKVFWQVRETCYGKDELPSDIFYVEAQISTINGYGFHVFARWKKEEPSFGARHYMELQINRVKTDLAMMGVFVSPTTNKYTCGGENFLVMSINFSIK